MTPATAHDGTAGTTPSGNATGSPAVRVADLVKRYPHTTAVEHIDLDVPAGEIFGLLGPNGAGKTTLLETVVGLRSPDEGEVRVLGLDPLADADTVRELTAVQPQHAALLPTLTVTETLRMWASFYENPAAVGTVLARVGLTEAANVRVGRLSGGQRQRALVATALVSDPQVLILDEPSTGLDPNARAELWHAIREHRDSGGTVLLSTHSMEEAETLCAEVAIIDRGRIADQGPPDELIRRHAPEQTLAFTVHATLTADSAVESLPDTLRATASVSRVETRPNGEHTRFHVRTTEPETVLVRVLTEDWPRISTIQTRDAGLDEVFRRLTGRGFDTDQPEETGAATS